MIELKWTLREGFRDEDNTPDFWTGTKSLKWVLQYRVREPQPTPVDTPDYELIEGYIWDWSDWQDVEISDE